MSDLEERIRRGLGAEVTVSADELIASAAAGAQRSRRQQQWWVGIGAAAAVLTVVAGALAVTRGTENTAPPVGPPPSGTPSVTYESPGPEDHPIEVYEADGRLTLVTVRRLEQGATATVWLKDAGGWRRLGTLDHAIPPVSGDPRRTRLAPGPGTQDIVALYLAGGRVGFSRDGGATWRYLPRPPGCNGWVCDVQPTTDHLFFTAADGTALRAAFGATAWEEFSAPAGVSALDDVLLGFDLDCDNPTNHYWVSRDDGDSWSGRRDFPAGTCIYGRVGNTAYAADPYETQWWRSTDLVHWKQAPTSPSAELSARAHAGCPKSLGVDPTTTWFDGPLVPIGDAIYKLWHVSRRSLELELRVSRDHCRTWKPALP